jgi:hypothetical protein
MIRRSHKKATGKAPKDGRGSDQKVEIPATEDNLVAETDSPRAPGMPAPESIIGESKFTSPKGFTYRIIHTTEVDPSDEPKPSNSKLKLKGNKSRRKGKQE